MVHKLKELDACIDSLEMSKQSFDQSFFVNDSTQVLIDMMRDIHSVPINLDLDREFTPIKSLPLRETWDMPKNNQLVSFLLSPSMSRVASLSYYESCVWSRMILSAKVFEWLHTVGRDKMS
jgi:hypothetical protein